MVDVFPECGVQLVGVLGAEVDLVFSAVEGKSDSACCLAAVEVINEKGLDPLGHGILLFLSGD
jgi:hypothetical protein